MESTDSHWRALAALDARHDDLLDRLDDLDRRVEQVLKGHLPPPNDGVPGAGESHRGGVQPEASSVPPQDAA